jgi:hypothetical protein
VTEDARDQRNPELADALAVPPLDDVTRRRLVRNAVDAADTAESTTPGSTTPSSPGRRSWAPLAAAAVVILLVVAVGVFALARSGGDSSDTAARQGAKTPAAVAPTAAPTAGSAESSGAAASVGAGVTAYGDLGDLSRASARDAARAKVASDGAAPAADLSEALLVRIADAACAASLRTEGTTLVGVGRATVDGNDAAVVVTRGADGTRTAHLLVFSPCDLRPL